MPLRKKYVDEEEVYKVLPEIVKQADKTMPGG